MNTRIKRIVGIHVILLLSLILLTACGGGGGYGSSSSSGTTSSTVQPVSCATVTADRTVVANGINSFIASAVTITVNQVVRWDNAPGGSAHTVTSVSVPANGTFNVVLPSPGSVCLKFTSPGSFSYYCSIHPIMTGLVTVN